MAERADIERVVLAAMIAAGPVRGDQFWEWRQRVQLLIPEISTAITEGSREWRRAEAVLDASHFTGTYLGYEYEESSTRLIVSIDAGKVNRKTGAKEIDTIRTERTDRPFGQFMRRRLDTYTVGDTVHVWKVNEPMAGDEMSNVRVLYHVIRTARAKVAEGTPSLPSAPGPAPVSPSRPEPVSDPASERVAEAMSRLSSPERVEVARRCRAAGLTNFVTPGPDVERVLTIIEDVVEER